LVMTKPFIIPLCVSDEVMDPNFNIDILA